MSVSLPQMSDKVEEQEDLTPEELQLVSRDRWLKIIIFSVHAFYVKLPERIQAEMFSINMNVIKIIIIVITFYYVQLYIFFDVLKTWVYTGVVFFQFEQENQQLLQEMNNMVDEVRWVIINHFQSLLRHLLFCWLNIFYMWPSVYVHDP